MEELSFAEMLEQTFKKVVPGEIISGNILDIKNNGDIVLDIGYKSDGIIPRHEYSFDRNADPKNDLKLGQIISVFVLKLNDGEGNILLSCKKIKSESVRKDFEEKIKNNFIFDEIISEVTEKGFVAKYQGIRIFIPLSLSGITKDTNIEEYKEKKVKFKITDYDYRKRKIIGSIKEVIEDEQKLADGKEEKNEQ